MIGKWLLFFLTDRDLLRFQSTSLVMFAPSKNFPHVAPVDYIASAALYSTDSTTRLIWYQELDTWSEISRFATADVYAESLECLSKTTVTPLEVINLRIGGRMPRFCTTGGEKCYGTLFHAL